MSNQTPRATWQIEIAGDKVTFSRFKEDKCIESYGAVDKGRAAIYAAAIVQGFAPPRGLARAADAAALGSWPMNGDAGTELNNVREAGSFSVCASTIACFGREEIDRSPVFGGDSVRHEMRDVRSGAGAQIEGKPAKSNVPQP